ncbi:MAG: type II secretion system protein GspF [Deltaproteobacteria bacterium]|nr:type II secretion system protein GspF [Deltaproteobacteria bacterium]
MPLFEYRALNKNGRRVSGIVTAEGSASARLKLSQDSIFPIKMKEVKASSRKSIAHASTSLFSRFHRTDPAALSTAMRQLATLVSSGLPLVDCLNALIEQTEKANLKKIFMQVREKVVAGSPLYLAMAEHPAVFAAIHINMVKAGEAASALDIILERLADLAEKRLTVKRKIDAALAYPMFLLIISTLLLIFMMSFVMPKVVGIFEGMELALPSSTRALIWFTHAMESYWWLAVLLVIALWAGAYAFTRKGQGRRIWDRLRLSFPLSGALHHKAAIARFSRTLSILLKSGIPLVEALDTARPSIDNKIMEDAVSNTTKRVGEGEDFAGPLERTGLFPPLVVQLIHAGEQSGELEKMLDKAADAYESDVESSVTALTSVLEPVIILVMGGAVFFIVISILLPIFDMTSGIR